MVPAPLLLSKPPPAYLSLSILAALVPPPSLKPPLAYSSLFASAAPALSPAYLFSSVFAALVLALASALLPPL